MTTNKSLPTAKDSIEVRKTLQGCWIIFTIITIMIMLQENVRFTWQASHESTLWAQIQVLRGNKVTGPRCLKMPPFKTQSSSKDFRKGNIRALVSIKRIPMYSDQNLDRRIAMKRRLRSLYPLKIQHSLNTGKDQSLWTQGRLLQCIIQMKCWEKLVFIMVILKRKSALRLDKILLGSSFSLGEKGSAF